MDAGSLQWVGWGWSGGFLIAFGYRLLLMFDDSLGRARVLQALDLGPCCLWVGAVLAVSGTLFRNWAVRSLGRFFTRTVQVSANQPVIDAGPYRWLRHPSYAGGLVSALGVAVALGSWIGVLAVGAGVTAGYMVRIRVEERALGQTLGEPYRAYQLRTWRLVPFLYSLILVVDNGPWRLSR